MVYLGLSLMRKGLMRPDGSEGGGEPETPGDTPEQNESEAKDAPAPADFSALLKDKGFQSDLDRYVNKALGTAKANWERDAQVRIKNAKTEGEKLAKLSAEERAKVDAEQKVADILAREKDMDERESGIMRRELLAQAKDTLAQKTLPPVLAEVLEHVSPSADAFNGCLEALEKAHLAGVQIGVETRMRPKEQPKSNTGESPALYATMRAAAGLETNKE